MPRAPKPIARLGWLNDDGEFVFEPHNGPNRVAAEQLVAHLDESEALATTHVAARVSLVMLAEAVDADPTNAALWGQYRAAEASMRALMEAGSGDAFQDLLAELAADGAAPVRDASFAEPADAGRADRQGRAGARSAADAPPGADRRRGRGAAS
jgi:hypothetical protein